jgi:hypothetical protein
MQLTGYLCCFICYDANRDYREFKKKVYLEPPEIPDIIKREPP